MRSDEELAAAVREGEQSALAEFLNSHRPQLIAFINRRMTDRLKGKVEPNDIVQEVTLSAFDSLPNVDLTGRDPFSWLCQLAERRITDAHRDYFGA